MNLLSNAVKFTQKGGLIKINSKLILRKEDFSYPDKITDDQLKKLKYGFLEVIVKDSGIGIK